MKIRRLALFAVLALVGSIWFWQRAPFNPANAIKFNDLTAEEQRVILRDGTERAFSGLYDDHKETGIYICKQCDRPLFESSSKFDSRTGWPSFDDFIVGAIREVPDGGQTEIECANCGGHIGHVFRGEGFTPKSTRHCANSISLSFVAASNEERAIFAGGCFWGVEHHLERIPGVLSATSGYVGGRVANPTYQDVLSKTTGHAEAVEVVYDASKVDYETLARMFFEIHDPTQVNRQGPDIGEQYRSAIFYYDDAQKETAEKLIGILESKGLKVATKLHPAKTFYPAEDYHQDFYQNNGKTPYCHVYKKRF